MGIRQTPLAKILASFRKDRGAMLLEMGLGPFGCWDTWLKGHYPKKQMPKRLVQL
jgi:hypothetical protein